MQSWPAPTRSQLPGRGQALQIFDGITPDDATHLGHAFTRPAYDVAHRALLDAGRVVRHVQNVTDVDGQALASPEIELFRHDMTELRILPPTHYVGAVEAIPIIIEMLEDLLNRGAAYGTGPGPVPGAGAGAGAPAMFRSIAGSDPDPDVEPVRAGGT